MTNGIIQLTREDLAAYASLAASVEVDHAMAELTVKRDVRDNRICYLYLRGHAFTVTRDGEGCQRPSWRIQTFGIAQGLPDCCPTLDQAKLAIVLLVLRAERARKAVA